MDRISRNRFALGSYHYLRYPMEYFLDTAVELGIENVELWAAAPQLFLQLTGPDRVRTLHGQLRSRGLRAVCITPEQCNYPINLASEDADLRRYSVDNFKKAVDVAAALECPKVLVTAGCGRYDRPTRPAWDLAVDSLGQLAAYAQPRGVTLTLETLTPISSNLLNTPAQQLEMIGHLPQGSTVAMLDIGQMAYMNQTLHQYLALGTLLRHVHLHDRGQAIHMALGDGALPLAEYLRRIEASGYKGLYAFEMNDPRYRADPRAADRQNVKWLESHGFF